MPIYRKINKDFFKKWSSSMAYTLGFMFADGNLTISNRGTYFFSIHTIDKPLLQKIIEEMDSDHSLSIRRKKSLADNYRLQVGSKEMCEDLLKLGLIPNKAKRMKLPDVPGKYFGDFTRGYFDGDGNIWVGLIHKGRKAKSYVIQSSFTSASIYFLEALLKKLRSCGLQKGFITISKTQTYGRLVFSKNDSLRLYKIMYNTSTSLYLPRKKQIFEKYMSLRL